MKKSEGIISLLIVFTNNFLSLIVSSHFQKTIRAVLHPEKTVNRYVITKNVFDIYYVSYIFDIHETDYHLIVVLKETRNKRTKFKYISNKGKIWYNSHL